MTVYVEGNLLFDFSSAVRSTKFDEEGAHGLTHCMKAVDFLVETHDAVLLIEAKDPDHPLAQARDVAVFAQELQSSVLTARELVPKCRDTFIYEWCCQDRAVDINKPWKYLVLIALSALRPPELIVLSDGLRRSLPVAGPPGQRWQPFVQDCQVFNLQTWSKSLGALFPVTRLQQ